MVVVSWVSHYNDGGIMSSGGELTCSMGMPGNSRIASIEEHLGEGLIGRLHPRESGNIYLHDANQSVALHHARHTGEMTTRRGV